MTHTVATFQATVKRNPSSPDAWFNLGKALADAGAFAGAVLAYRRSAELGPGDASVHYNLANTLRRAGDTDAAIDAYRNAITWDANNASIHLNLGSALDETGDLDGAVEAYKEALRCDPRSARVFNNLGNVYDKRQQYARAEEAYRSALRLEPDLPDAWYNLAGVLARQDRPKEAEAAYRGALRLRPEFLEAVINLAGVVQDMGRFTEAIELLRHAVGLQPASAEAHFNLGLALLQSGAWEEGWTEFAWRHKTVDALTHARSNAFAPWDGVVRSGETLLVRAEQGYGDTLQCARFLPLLAMDTMRVVFECRPELVPLFEGWRGRIDVTTPDRPMTGVMREVGLLSLPAILRITPHTIPSRVPYLRAPEDRSVAWRSRLSAGRRALHVGIVASGNPAHKNDRRRSIAQQDLLPLFGVQGVVWHTLLSPSAIQASAFPPGLPVVHHGDEISDFGDSAALVQNLDLLISVDTAPAHLAGALGCPVWVMLPYNPDWRWLLIRNDTPWYPTMKLFRQPAPGAWMPVVEQVREELARLTRAALPEEKA